MAVSLIFSDFQWSRVPKKRLWRNAVALAVSISTHFTKLLTLMCEQSPISSRGSEQETSPSDAHTVVDRSPAVVAATLLPLCSLSRTEEPQ